ncbi:hypothetical protein Huta_1297 [Halorhabdus utahensis DSM 12940]|uniref:Uncharacterized protein n=1 Tax=Halorhabdus utahensis (strain DSM 12940 / JCM 11049 / AX-2) TaxID=519442 RepID=C7NN73_HALUD|nr:hypothetical protein [Halorhabdus utahensis]ACV11473.1 hypothetical protein Huta_1297 [Halorhabdus utahensis DSM 12940]
MATTEMLSLLALAALPALALLGLAGKYLLGWMQEGYESAEGQANK